MAAFQEQHDENQQLGPTVMPEGISLSQGDRDSRFRGQPSASLLKCITLLSLWLSAGNRVAICRWEGLQAALREIPASLTTRTLKGAARPGKG
jgi:hypothetical protein